MTKVLITCDTELSAALHQRATSPVDNAASSLWGQTGKSAVGIGWQMDSLDRHGLTGVFFVDPMPSLVYGSDFLTRVVEVILSRGHEVQLHIHTEWLAWAKTSRVGGRLGTNIGDFSFDDQLVLLGQAIELLVGAGAPRPTAFRAGNYGADDRTLAALATLGLRWDSSLNPCFLGSSCRIGLPTETRDPVKHRGIIEVPVAAINDRPGHLRPAQVCALSSGEMRAALRHAGEQQHAVFTIVTHSFEMLSRDRARINHMVARRYSAMCEEIATNSRLRSSGFNELDPSIVDKIGGAPGRLEPDSFRTGRRVVEQAISTIFHERRVRSPQ